MFYRKVLLHIEGHQTLRMHWNFFNFDISCYIDTDIEHRTIGFEILIFVASLKEMDHVWNALTINLN